MFYNSLLLVLTVVQAHGFQTILYATSGGYVRQGLSDELVCECPPSSCATSAPAEFYKQDKKIFPSSDYRFPGDRKMIILMFDYDKEGTYSCAIDSHTSPDIDLKVKLPVSITLPAATDVYAKEGVSSGFEISLITPQRPIWVNFSRIQNDTIDLQCSELVHPSSDEQVVRCPIFSTSLDDGGYYQVAVGASWYKVRIVPFYLHVQASQLNLSCTALTPTSINVSLSYVPMWNHQVVLKASMEKTILASLQKTSFEVNRVHSCTDYEITVLPSSSSRKPSTCVVKTPCVSPVTAMNITRYKNRVFQRCGEYYQELCIFTNGDFEQLEKTICNSTRNNEISENQIQMNIFTKIKHEENSSVAVTDFCAETVALCSYTTLNCKISDFSTFRPTSDRPTKEVDTAVSSDIIIGSVVGCLVVLGVGLVIIAFVVKKRLCKCKKQGTGKNDFEMASPSAADSKPGLNSETSGTDPLPDSNEEILQVLLEIRDEFAAKAQAEANSQRVEVLLNSFKHEIISAIRNRDDQLLQQCVSSVQSSIANLTNHPDTTNTIVEVSGEKLVRSAGVTKKSRQSAARAGAEPDSSILANHYNKSKGTAALSRVNLVGSAGIVEESLQTTARSDDEPDSSSDDEVAGKSGSHRLATENPVPKAFKEILKELQISRRIESQTLEKVIEQHRAMEMLDKKIDSLKEDISLQTRETDVVSGMLCSLNNTLLEVYVQVENPKIFEKPILELFKKLAPFQDDALAKMHSALESLSAKMQLLPQVFQTVTKICEKLKSSDDVYQNLLKTVGEIEQILLRQEFSDNFEELTFREKALQCMESNVYHSTFREGIKSLLGERSLVLIIYVKENDVEKTRSFITEVNRLEQELIAQFKREEPSTVCVHVLPLCREEISQRGGEESCINLIDISSCILPVCTEKFKDFLDMSGLEPTFASSNGTATYRKIVDALQECKNVVPVSFHNQTENFTPTAYQSFKRFKFRGKESCDGLFQAVRNMTAMPAMASATYL